MYRFANYGISYKEFKIYEARVLSCIRKKTTAEIVEVDSSETSRYTNSKNLIELSRGAEKETLYHEMGHEVFHRYCGDDIINVDEFVIEFDSIGGTKEAAMELLYIWYQELKEGMSIRHPINIVSDVFGMLANATLEGYRCHNEGYIDKNWEHDPIKNEAFATMFATFASHNVARYCFMKNNYPMFVISCQNLIDKMSWT